MRRAVLATREITQRFNPRICKRCDYYDPHRLLIPGVSIHASVKDATVIKHITVYSFIVSIHASVKDATAEQELRSLY